jgi:hypothetical protein
VCLSRPIKNNVANIPLPFTTYDYYEGDDNINCKWYAEDATGSKRNIASFYSTKYKATILFTPYDGLNKCYYYTEEDGLTKVIEYMVDDCKSNYAYYYKNALGGYDVLCVSGKMVQVDNLERKTIEIYKDGKQNFENVITRTYSTFTGYLTEEQSLLMHHLLNSTEVYLYDIQEATYVPVVLTNTSTEYKTKQNQNKKMISYNITCEEATKKYRR